MKSIWITGASSGIGKALALKFANEGWQVAASARREDLLNKIAESNKNISSFPLDVTDGEKCKEIFGQIKNKLQIIWTTRNNKTGIRRRRRIQTRLSVKT